MIKVGQIYAPSKKDTLRDIVCVTSVHNYDTYTEVDYITRQGVTFSHDDIYFLKLSRKLIASYPTWQEAVNSPEFRGEK